MPVCVLDLLDVDHTGMGRSTWLQSRLAPQVGFHGHLCNNQAWTFRSSRAAGRTLQTLWQGWFDDCCAELKIPLRWL